eukprot:5958254-Amphidinium_carterae.1
MEGLWFSNFETATGILGQSHPCFMIGVSPDTFHRRVEFMTTAPKLGRFAFYFNFDINSWSS